MNRLFERTAPELCALLNWKIDDRRDGSEFYEIRPDGDKVLLCGSSQTAVAAAFYRFLGECCALELSPCGNTKIYTCDSISMPKKVITQTIPYDRRMSMTYETYMNDAFCWDWDRWERELDFLAMQGVNMIFMPVGQEAVWYYGALDMGINREDAMEFLSSPCYYPLQLAGRLDTVFPMTDTNYLKAQIKLGQRIVERMRELGMEPVLPAFNGHVPQYMKGYFSGAGLFFVMPYGQYPFTYRVFPDDALFEKTAFALANKQTEFFGEAKYYLADPFYGVSPRMKADTLLPAYGKAIQRTIQSRHPGAVWVSHACEHTDTLLRDVDAQSVLILDTDGTANSFGGKPFVSGTRCNFGGHSVLCGNADTVFQKKDAVGRGIFCEYALANPLYMDCAFRALTTPDISAQDFFVQSAIRRWGSDEACLREAAKLLYDNCYCGAPSGAVGSIPACRPSTELAHTAPGDTLQLHYDNKALCQALECMLASKGDYTDGYAFDVCDVTRQVLSNYARRLYVGVIEGYQKRDSRLFETSTNAFLRLLSDMDRLLHTRSEFCLHTHLLAAQERAEGNTNKQNFEVAFLSSVTMFGPFKQPEFYDMLWKEWADLLNTYYAERWHEFFTLLAKGFKKRKNISTVCRKQIDGRNPCRGDKFGKTLDKKERHWITTCKTTLPSEEDTLEVAAELLQKYKPMIEREYIQ